MIEGRVNISCLWAHRPGLSNMGTVLLKLWLRVPGMWSSRSGSPQLMPAEWGLMMPPRPHPTLCLMQTPCEQARVFANYSNISLTTCNSFVFFCRLQTMLIFIEMALDTHTHGGRESC